MPSALDISGRTFGKLVAQSPVIRDGKRKWICLCQCGRVKEIETNSLTSGNSKSCGRCILLGNDYARRHGHSPKGSVSPTYTSWESMCKRVSSREGYAHVDIDPRWLDFSEFVADMGTRPDGTTIDRINNDRGYWKDNCRWASKETQSRNRRIACTAVINGREMAVADWAREFGISYGAAYARLRKKGCLRGGYNVRRSGGI